jgi:hypothetical protein
MSMNSQEAIQHAILHPEDNVALGSLDEEAQRNGYPDFETWKSIDPYGAQQAVNKNPMSDYSAQGYSNVGPTGANTIPWKDLAINFGGAIGGAMLAGVGGAAGGVSDAYPSLAGQVTPYSGLGGAGAATISGAPAITGGIAAGGAAAGVGAGGASAADGVADGITSVTPGPGFASSELAGGTGSSLLSGLGKYAQSNAGSSLIGTGLNALGKYADQKRQDELTQQQQQFAAYQLQQQLANQRQGQIVSDQANRSANLATQSPVGWDQNYEQQNMIKGMLLNKLMSGNSIPVPQSVKDSWSQSGYTPGAGYQIPDSWKNSDLFGMSPTMQSIGNRQNVLQALAGGNAPSIDFNNYRGIDPSLAANLNTSTQQQQDKQKQLYNAITQQYKQGVGTMVNGQYQQPTDPNAFWQKIQGYN